MGYSTGEGRKIVVQEGKIDTWTTWEYSMDEKKYKKNKHGSVILEEGSDDYNAVVMLEIKTEEGEFHYSGTGSSCALYLKDVEHLIDGLEKLRKRMILAKADQERNYRLNNEGEENV